MSLGLLLIFGEAQLVLSPVVRVPTALAFRAISTAHRQIALDAGVGRCSDQGYLYLLTGADPSVTLYAWASLAFHAQEKAGAERVRVLSFSPHRSCCVAKRRT